MCGIVAVFGDLEANDLLKHRQLLKVNEIRGDSATGVVGISKDGKDFKVVKRALAASDFVCYEATDLKKVWSTSNKGIIGHNRAPTVGVNSDKNAHPFTCGDVVGVHNGTLVDSSLKDLPSPEWFSTDSEQLYNNIAKHGVKDTFQYLWGAWATVWFDRKQNKIFALRNDLRPLYYCYDKSLRKLWIASEKKMLDWILTRDDLSTKSIDIHQDKIYELPSDQLYSWYLGDNKKVFADKPTEVKSGQKVPFKPARAPLHTQWTPLKPSAISSSTDETQAKMEKCANYLTASKTCQNSTCQCKIGPGTPLSIGTVTPSSTTTTKGSHLTLVKSTPKEKADELYGIPFFLDQELKDLPESSVRMLYNRVDTVIDELIIKDNATTEALAKENWSDFITWNKKTTERVQGMLDACDRRYNELQRLYAYKEKVGKQVERREWIRAQVQAHKEKEEQENERMAASRLDELKAEPEEEHLNTQWYADGVFYKTLANKFISENSLSKYIEKHYVGCANCGEANPLNFDIANSIELMDEMGYCCDSCKNKPRVLNDIIKPYGMVA